MAAQRLREILVRTEKAHQQLSDYYRYLNKAAVREDARILLDHLSRREDRMAHILHDYREMASAHLLDCWFNVAPDVGVSPNIALIQFHPNLPPEDIATMASLFNRCLLNMFRELLAQASSDELCEVVRNLLEMEIREDFEMQCAEWNW